jgi:hypothetical protein
MTRLALAAALLLGAVSTASAERSVSDGWPKNSYYKANPLFHYYPDPKGAQYIIHRFGPVGMGIELIQPAFTMRVYTVEPDSPAAATGKLKKGQFIESINGVTMKDVDPRVLLGNLITKIEATDGLVKLMVKDKRNTKAEEVVVKIPVLGAYSDTWPMNCKKSDQIVRNFADFLARTNKTGYGAALFLLSTGEEKDLDVVRGWFKDKLSKDRKGYPWDIGYTGPAICEYFLRTGDESVLPAIKSMADHLKKTIYNGSWAGRGGAPFPYMAGGHMNAAGVHCVTYLLLAKECGVDVDEHTLQTSLKHFYRFVGRGNTPYGDGLPEGGFVDNGRVGGLAFAMSAAASLTPEGEKTVYARARDISATKSFYSTSWMFHGHTGGGIGEIWRSAAMGLMKDKRPTQYRSFMNERRWVYELSRCYDGAFGITSGSINRGYDVTGHRGGRSWGNYFPLVYTIPRKKLRIHGAPPTKFCKTYQLPKRPWGNAADDAFYSVKPGEYKTGKVQDISKEEIPTDASWPILRRVSSSEVSDDTLLMYAHHIDQGIRSATARTINRMARDHLVVELLKSKDPRGRHTGAAAIAGQFKGRSLPSERLTDEMVNLLAVMINDPDESWWSVHRAMEAIRLARPELIAPHVDRLAFWLKHDEWWLRKAAMTALTPVVADKRFYKKVLPIIGEMVASNERAVALSPLGGVVRQLQSADSEVQEFAVKVFSKAYADFPTELNAPGGQDMKSAVSYLLNSVSGALAGVPGGYDQLYTVAQKRFPGQALPHKDLYLGADTSRFGPKVKEVFVPILLEELVPEYIGRNRTSLLAEVAGTSVRRSAMEGLTALYRKAGIHDYNWQQWGPARDKIKWDYHTYDPKEEKLWTNGWRWRKVSWPEGMESWFAPQFGATKAGWKIGFAPFANKAGKLAAMNSHCTMDFCRCADKPNTFWEKEVLLMRAKIKLPTVREGYRYRLLVGGRSHVGGGDGSDIWIDGKYKNSGRNRPSIPGVGKRQGARPWGFVIDNELRKEFVDGTITLAATGFLRKHNRSGILSNYQCFWFEEMKLPTIGEKEIIKSASLVPMTSMAWQEKQDPENMELQSDDDLFRWDGKFVANPQALGAWKVIHQVKAIDEFTTDIKRMNPGRPPFRSITFREAGKTDNILRIWSGDVLMDLTKNQALKMKFKTIGDNDYLFIEAGGFSKRNKAGWQPSLYVLKRQKRRQGL